MIDGLGLDRVVLFALSAGGWPAVVYTVQHPEKVRRLVLIATAAAHAVGCDPKIIRRSLAKLERRLKI